jgi:hypothetical protein
VELERLFRDDLDNLAVIQTLAEELTHRKTQRARTLADQVRRRLEELGAWPAAAAVAPDNTPVRLMPAGAIPREEPDGESEVEPEPELELDSGEQGPRPTAAVPSEEHHEEPDHAHPDDMPVTGTLPPDSSERAGPPRNDPAAILDLWTALEVLSPQTYVQASDLADGEARRIARFGEGSALPWARGPEKARPNTKLYYLVILGALAMDRASAVLLKAFGDKRPERSQPRGYAALAAVTVDREGRLVAERPVAVSSFGWGYGLARAGSLSELKTWPEVERGLTQGLEDRLKREEDDEVLPLDEATILRGFQWLCGQVGLPIDECVAPSFAIRLYRWNQAKGDPAPMLLNSFFLEDLARCHELHSRQSLGPALGRYLSLDTPKSPVALLENKTALEAAVAPIRTPAARWPTPGGYPLVLLQQAAVNLVLEKLSDSPGILGVNGPPGTGKTTLLRDLVAGVVLARARALAAFDNPEEAFRHQGRIRRGQAFIHLYELDSTIRGHELLVASSNNKAVENISRELPGRNQIEASLAPRYFATTAAAVAGEGQEAWGLIAGVLGNAANRVAFRRDFWADPNVGLRAYLWAAAGHTANAGAGQTPTAIPRVVTEERPPHDKRNALARWQLARREFLRAVKAAEAALRELERVRESILARAKLRAQHAQLKAHVDEADALLQAARSVLGRASGEAKAAAEVVKRAERALRDHRAIRPSWFSRIFRRMLWRTWAAEMSLRGRTRGEAIRSASVMQGRHDEARHQAAARSATLATAQTDLARVDGDLSGLERHLEEARAALKGQLPDEDFWGASHADLQTSTPWLTPEVQRLRDLCFKTALELHRAFIDVAAKPIRNNLNALFGVLMGDGLDDSTVRLLPSLWSTLFLVVPVISTTFASVGRMLGPMPPQSLGWLLIDEGGQAIPQAAVGAIMRARRAIIVGDPLQIEPVVTLPLSLVDRIALRMSVDPATWTAPKASAQTLADTACQYQSWIEQIEGAVRVGIPLLVHRRCAEPMFGISNSVAYAGKMVQAKRPTSSQVREALGPSRWLHISGDGSGKWCPAEGQIVMNALRTLVSGGLADPDIFIITPFRIVARQMREMLAVSDVIRRIADRPWEWVRNRVGTVHTFQGREAEAVFLVLGAPDATQTGARNWAGHPPNLANVAVSRAKEVLYVVGNRELWRMHGSFRAVSDGLPN